MPTFYKQVLIIVMYVTSLSCASEEEKKQSMFDSQSISESDKQTVCYYSQYGTCSIRVNENRFQLESSIRICGLQEGSIQPCPQATPLYGCQRANREEVEWHFPSQTRKPGDKPACRSTDTMLNASQFSNGGQTSFGNEMANGSATSGPGFWADDPSN